MQHESSTAATAEEDRSHGFDCNICLDHVKEPVVTLCGHLYCWPCLYRWILNHNQCPVCKAGVTQENIIPVYGRGSKSVDPRKQEPPLGDGVPDRPRGQRPEPISRRRHTVGVDGMQEVGFSPTIGFFPSLFGLQFQHATYPLPDTINTSAQADAQQRVQHIFLSRFLLIVGSIVLLCLVTF
ncbi:hypothetical protein AC1031_000872 [Aphanomyces cochlioides]|nr:hypothetical protein AC1031_000872 [Aphanomyces cochlioides]